MNLKFLLVLPLFLLISCSIQRVEPTATIVSTPEPTATIVSTPEPTATIVSTPEPTATIVSTPEPTATIVSTPEPTATIVSTPESTATIVSTPESVVTLIPSIYPYVVGSSAKVGSLNVGAYFPSNPYDGFDPNMQFQNATGVKMQYALWFQAWGDGDKHFNVGAVQTAHALGMTPVITWEPWQRDFDNRQEVQEEYSFESITNGQHDEYIRSWAQGARSAGGEIILRFAHEQSTTTGTVSWYPWQGDPEGFKAAFRYIHAFFQAEGATNVKFLWSAMWLENAGVYYPGDDVVDIIGTTVLNHGTATNSDWGEWFEFDILFEQQYAVAQSWGKPILITELGSAEQGGDKAQWIRDVFEGARTKYPFLEGILLLEVKSDREWETIDWSVTSSTEAYTAFVEEAVK